MGPGEWPAEADGYQKVTLKAKCLPISAMALAIGRGLEALGSRGIDLDRLAKELTRKVK